MATSFYDNTQAREFLRGAEAEIFDLICKGTRGRWADWLRDPLEEAAYRGELDIARKLMAAGADFGEATHMAVSGSRRQIAAEILHNGADVHFLDRHGDAAIHVAARLGRESMLRWLVAKGANVDHTNRHDRTPLHLAARGGHLRVVRALLREGARVDIRDYDECFPLDLAARGGHVAILTELIEHGADVDAASSAGFTALHDAAAFNAAGSIAALIAAGADVETHGIEGNTPLSYAAHKGSCEAVLALLEHGADVNAQNVRGESPLHAAARKAGDGNVAEVVDLLLRWGGDETISDNVLRLPAEYVIVDVADEEERMGEISYSREEVNRVWALLVNAPADRAWRRRGMVLLCRAHHDRRQQGSAINPRPDIGEADFDSPRPAKLARIDASAGGCQDSSGGGTGDDSAQDEVVSHGLRDVLTKVLDLKEEGIFRTIVGYL